MKAKITRPEIKEAITPIVLREINARNAFYEVVMSVTGCNLVSAEKVLSVYLKLKVAKIDYGVGHVSIKHGVYYEKDVLMNAINY